MTLDEIFILFFVFIKSIYTYSLFTVKVDQHNSITLKKDVYKKHSFTLYDQLVIIYIRGIIIISLWWHRMKRWEGKILRVNDMTWLKLYQHNRKITMTLFNSVCYRILLYLNNRMSKHPDFRIYIELFDFSSTVLPK